VNFVFLPRFRRKDSDPTTLSSMRFPVLRAPRAWRRARRTVVALAAVGLALILLDQIRIGASLFGAALLCLTILESAHLRGLIGEGQRQQYALTQIRPLLGELPLEIGGWAADGVMVHNAVRLMLVARCLRALGGRIISLEHNPEYARRTSELLRLNGLDNVATVVTAPLAVIEVEGKAVPWYGNEYECLLGEPIDVLLIDGPPKATAPRARYPAVPLLKSHLAAQCWILMDDGDRQDERAIAHAWSRDLGATLTYLEGGRGGWLLHRPGAADHIAASST
jgi:hypothetical protein